MSDYKNKAHFYFEVLAPLLKPVIEECDKHGISFAVITVSPIDGLLMEEHHLGSVRRGGEFLRNMFLILTRWFYDQSLLLDRNHLSHTQTTQDLEQPCRDSAPK